MQRFRPLLKRTARTSPPPTFVRIDVKVVPVGTISMRSCDSPKSLRPRKKVYEIDFPWRRLPFKDLAGTFTAATPNPGWKFISKNQYEIKISGISMGGPEFQEILFWTTNKPPKWILGGSIFHSSGRIFKESDDRGMQFAAVSLKVGEDSIFFVPNWNLHRP